MSAFFPDPLFGWIFLAALFGILAVAAWKDLRAMMVPKWLTVPALALGARPDTGNVPADAEGPALGIRGRRDGEESQPTFAL